MVLATGIVLWTTGLATGAIHPVGFALCLMLLGAMTWFFIAWGLLCAVAAATPPRAANAGMCSTILLAISGGLPFLLPAKFSSVLLGAGSSPFVIWLAQLSYRDVRNAIHHAAYPHLHWIAIDTGEGAACRSDLPHRAPRPGPRRSRLLASDPGPIRSAGRPAVARGGWRGWSTLGSGGLIRTRDATLISACPFPPRQRFEEEIYRHKS